MDRLTAMEVSVRVVEAGSFSGAEDCSASDSPQSPRPPLGLTWSFRSGTAEETVTLKGEVQTTSAVGLRKGGLCRTRVVRLRMDVPAGSRQRQGQPGIASLEPAAD